MKANEMQVGGGHYKDAQAWQHWDFVEATGPLPYMEAAIIKYISRHRNKDGRKDVQKAIHFTVKLIELRDGTVNDARVQRLEQTERWCRVNGINEPERQIILLVVNWTRVDDLYIAITAMKKILEQYDDEARAKLAELDHHSPSS